MARITEKLRILVDHCADEVKNPFYLMWYNSLGGPEFHLFGIKQIEGRNVTNIETYTPNFGSISNAQSVESQLSKESRAFIECTSDNLTRDDITKLLSLKESIKVLWLRDKDNPNDVGSWQEVFPEGGSYSFNNVSEGYTFTIRINFQKRFTPSN